MATSLESLLADLSSEERAAVERVLPLRAYTAVPGSAADLVVRSMIEAAVAKVRGARPKAATDEPEKPEPAESQAEAAARAIAAAAKLESPGAHAIRAFEQLVSTDPRWRRSILANRAHRTKVVDELWQHEEVRAQFHWREELESLVATAAVTR